MPVVRKIYFCLWKERCTLACGEKCMPVEKRHTFGCGRDVLNCLRRAHQIFGVYCTPSVIGVLAHHRCASDLVCTAHHCFYSVASAFSVCLPSFQPATLRLPPLFCKGIHKRAQSSKHCTNQSAYSSNKSQCSVQ